MVEETLDDQVMVKSRTYVVEQQSPLFAPEEGLPCCCRAFCACGQGPDLRLSN